MKKLSLHLKENIFFLLSLFLVLTFELVVENIGLNGAYLPNLVMCVVFSFAYLLPIPLWVIVISVTIGESFFSTTPALMSFLIICSYFILTKLVSIGGIRQRNFHIVIFVLSCIVVYSIKILWLFLNDLRPEVASILIKMLMTIIIFPLFYLVIGKLQKLL